jgi:hypothetical protein
VARFAGATLGLLPHPILTSDQVHQLEVDNIVSSEAVSQGRTLAALGIEPTSMEAVLPSYMWRFRTHGQYDRQTA